MFDGKSFIEKFARIFSTETDWKVEENSQEEDYKKITCSISPLSRIRIKLSGF